MSIAQGLEAYLKSTKQDVATEKFQQQYCEMMKKGVIQPRGYNLAGVNVIGDKAPSLQASVDLQGR